MQFDLIDLIVLSLAASLMLAWWRFRQQHERITRITARYCAQNKLQLLDETISFTAVFPKRLSNGHLGLRWRYRFEFTATGSERYIGTCTCIANKQPEFQLPPYRMPDELNLPE